MKLQRRRIAAAWLPALLWMAFIFYLSSQSNPLAKTPPSDFNFVAHFGEYAILAFLLFWAQLATGGWKGNIRVALAASFLLASLYGASDEYHQSFVEGRIPSWVDWGMDLLGAAFAVAVIARWWRLLLWRQSRYRRTVLPADPRRGRS